LNYGITLLLLQYEVPPSGGSLEIGNSRSSPSPNEHSAR